MKILAIDTSTKTGSVALISNDELIAEQCLNVGVTHSEHLIKSIDEVLSHAGLKVEAQPPLPFGEREGVRGIDCFAIAIGPGSFTGLRIGLATIKGLALATDKPIVAVSSLLALACNACGADGIIVPMFDAKKGEVYAAAYRSNGAMELWSNGAMRLEEVIGECVISPEELCNRLLKSSIINLQSSIIKYLLLGDGAAVYRETFIKRLGGRLIDLPPGMMLPRASNVAFLALPKFQSGETADITSLVPNYIRRSDAELRLRA